MKKLTTAVLLISVALLGGTAYAAAPAKDLGTCMIDALNGKERKLLAKWVFFAMAAHPDIKTYSKITPKDVDTSDRFIGGLVTRLLTKDCPTQLKAANAADPMALKKSFELVGRVAMQELMSNQNVMKSISNYANYADLETIGKLISKKPPAK